MFKKYILLINFIVFLSILSFVGLSFNQMMISLLSSTFPGIDDIKYIAGVYNESEEEIVLASLMEETPVEEDSEIIIEDNFSYGLPNSLDIKSVNISLPVETGYYDYNNQTWTISKGKAYWAELSSLPNEFNSNTVLYAHNQWTEFSKTKNLKIGDEIIITTDLGYSLTYEYYSDEFVDPTWGELFEQRTDFSRLTLITCNGVNDEFRRLIYAKLIKTSFEGKEQQADELVAKTVGNDFVSDLQNSFSDNINDINFGKPVLLQLLENEKEIEIFRGWLSVQQLSKIKITNDYMARLEGYSYIGEGLTSVIYLYSTDTIWSDLVENKEIIILTDQEQLIKYEIVEIFTNDFTSISNTVINIEPEKLVIIVQGADEIRIITGVFREVIDK